MRTEYLFGLGLIWCSTKPCCGLLASHLIVLNFFLPFFLYVIVFFGIFIFSLGMNSMSNYYGCHSIQTLFGSSSCKKDANIVTNRRWTIRCFFSPRHLIGMKGVHLDWLATGHNNKVTWVGSFLFSSLHDHELTDMKLAIISTSF